MAQSNAFTNSGAISGFVSGTQKPLPTIFNKTASGSQVPGTPTAAGNLSLSGSAYFQNLLNNGTPTEKAAAQSYFSRNPSTPAVGNNPGMISQAQHPTAPTAQPTTHTVTTDPKTGATTTKQTFTPTDAKTTPSQSAPVSSTAPGTNGNPGTDFKQNLSNTAGAGNQTQNESQTQQAVINAGQFSPEEKAANDAVARANAQLTGYQNVQSLSPYAEAGMYANAATTPGGVQNIEQAPDLAGRAGATNGLLGTLGNIYGTANLSGAQSALQGIQTQRAREATTAGVAYGGSQNQANRALGANQSVQSATQPQFTGYGNAQFNPGTNTYGSVGGGQYGSGPGAASNVQSIQSAQTGLNDLAQYTPTITSNLTRAGDLAKQANLDPNSPLITGLQHALSTGLITNQGLTAFNSVISSLNDALAKVGEAPIDLNTTTPSALNQLIQTIPNNLSVKKNSYDSFINGFNGGSSSGSSGGTGGSLFGSFF